MNPHNIKHGPYCIDIGRGRVSGLDIDNTPMFKNFEPFDPNFYDLEEPCSCGAIPDILRPKYGKHEFLSPYKIKILRASKDSYKFGSAYFPDMVSDGHTYYKLKHGDEYGVQIINNTSSSINASLKIDSDFMGKWLVGPMSSVFIERPAHNPRKFMFVKEKSEEAVSGKVRQGDKSELNGLVEVTFTPLKNNYWSSSRYNLDNVSQPFSNSSHSSRPVNMMSASILSSSRGPYSKYEFDILETSLNNGVNNAVNNAAPQSASYEAGATVLGEDSNQKFRKINTESRGLVEDTENSVKKAVRIIIDNRPKIVSIRDSDYNYKEENRHIPPKIPNEMLGKHHNEDIYQRYSKHPVSPFG